MSYLIDTNIISELTRPKPDRRVVHWFDNVADSALYLSVLSLGEIRNGIERLQKSQRKECLMLWLEQELPAWFEDRLLPIDAGVADRWGRLLAESGRSVPAIDSLLAATAIHHDLRLVTRNVSDFPFSGLTVVNPWDS
ncbi:MAG: type II toxin-antitoxin system VapC family toxin [Vulcanimicrobiota bacterium]